MGELSLHVGQRIKMYRKVQRLTIQELANRIHKSRATVSKYENGEVVLDIETIYEISKALHVEISQLTDFKVHDEENVVEKSFPIRKSPFLRQNVCFFTFLMEDMVV